MSDEVVSAYAKRSEGMVRPADVSLITLFGSLLGKLPIAVQKRIMSSNMDKTPYMGFVVEPYATFLCHEITDLERAKALLPRGFRLAPARIFEGDDDKYMVIFGAFTVHTSAFWGTRLEMYIVAEHEQSGMLSWVIVDYDSNTLSFDPGKGFVDGNADPCVLTTTHRGKVVVDIASAGRRFAVQADLRKGIETPLDQRLWIEGNLSISYGGELDDGAPVPFGVIFEPGEMERALRIPVAHTEIEAQSWHQGLYDPTPFEVACFPYAQHFITTGVPQDLGIRDRADLDAAVAKLNAEPPEGGFSSEEIKRAMGIGFVVSTVTTWSLIFWFVVHWWTQH